MRNVGRTGDTAGSQHLPQAAIVERRGPVADILIDGPERGFGVVLPAAAAGRHVPDADVALGLVQDGPRDPLGLARARGEVETHRRACIRC